MRESLTAAVPIDDWPQFCDAFSRQHQGWLVTLSVVETARLEAGRAGAPQVVARDQALEGLLADPPRPQRALTVLLGRPPGRLAHTVAHPRALWVLTAEDGSHLGLRIDDREGHSTLLHFRAPARPETLDGLAGGEIG